MLKYVFQIICYHIYIVYLNMRPVSHATSSEKKRLESCYFLILNSIAVLWKKDKPRKTSRWRRHLSLFAGGRGEERVKHHDYYLSCRNIYFHLFRNFFCKFASQCYHGWFVSYVVSRQKMYSGFIKLTKFLLSQVRRLGWLMIRIESSEEFCFSFDYPYNIDTRFPWEQPESVVHSRHCSIRTAAPMLCTRVYRKWKTTVYKSFWKKFSSSKIMHKLVKSSHRASFKRW